ncbi:MAG: hypothetical protein JSU66_10140 [Deltaproteobacteria bacterium]|nr:MAG: hypothetical protein JSU66_10140 [Deltaproteobacteria bacterium]
MHRTRLWLLAINLVGGIAVLGSYASGLASHPGSAGAVWGGVPEGLRPLYTVSMLLAAAGYFAFSYLVFFRIDPDRDRLAGRFAYGAFPVIYALILVPSALWMPLTFAMLESPSLPLWIAIRVTLAVVGLASLGLLAAILSVKPRPAPVAHAVAIVGAAAFSFQTAVLDALVWPAYFPV